MDDLDKLPTFSLTPPEPDRPKKKKGAKIHLKVAYGAVAAAAALLLVEVYLLLRSVPLNKHLPVIIPMGVLCVAAGVVCHFAMRRRLGLDSDSAALTSIFPVVICFAPMMFIAGLLISWQMLLFDRSPRARINGKPIGGQGLQGLGRPVALAVIILSLWMLSVILASVGVVQSIGLEPMEVSWSGEGRLVCQDNDRYRVVGLKVKGATSGKPLIHASAGCRVRLERCSLDALYLLHVGDEAQVTLVDCKLRGELPNTITADRKGRLEVRGGSMTLHANPGLLMRDYSRARLDAVTIRGSVVAAVQSRVEAKGGSWRANKAAALTLGGYASASLQGVTLGGAPGLAIKGPGRLRLRGGRVEGATLAAKIEGDQQRKARLDAVGVTFVGKEKGLEAVRAVLLLRRGSLRGRPALFSMYSAASLSDTTLEGGLLMGDGATTLDKVTVRAAVAAEVRDRGRLVIRQSTLDGEERERGGVIERLKPDQRLLPATALMPGVAPMPFKRGVPAERGGKAKKRPAELNRPK